MLINIKTSANNHKVVSELTRKLPVGTRENVIARLAIGYSISLGNKFQLKEMQDQKGKEYKDQILFDEKYKDFYLALICQHYAIYKNDEDIPKYLKMHLDDGLELLGNITYYGGKQKMAKEILPLIPPHRLYCEPFFGGGAIFFSKEPSKVEVVNDINSELINYYKVVKTQFKELEREIKTTLSSRKLHTKACVIYQYPDLFTDVARAWAIWVLSTQSYGSILGSTWNKDNKENQTVKQLNSKRLNSVEEYAKRLENTQIECKDALYVIRSRDGVESFFYLDPPYFNSHLGHYRGYEEIDFEKLLIQLSEIKGKFLLSSYPSELLTKYVKKNKWYQKKVEKQVCMAGNPKVKRKTKTETLTANYVI